MLGPADEDRKLLAKLREACAAGRVRLEIDADHLAHIHSPIARDTDVNLLLYPAIGLVAAVWWLVGWMLGVGVATICVAFYFMVGRRWRHARLRQRIEDRALTNLELWRRLWRWGGVSLERSGPHGSIVCRAPEQKWHSFVGELDPPHDSQVGS
jgi:hypothetical protein